MRDRITRGHLRVIHAAMRHGAAQRMTYSWPSGTLATQPLSYSRQPYKYHIQVVGVGRSEQSEVF
jgi:hypothetical protein